MLSDLDQTLAVDQERSPAEVPLPRRTLPRVSFRIVVVTILVGLIAGGLVWMAVLHLERGSRSWDAHAQLAVVDRVERLGGPYYSTGTDQKGPLWLASYEIALRLSNRRDVWFVIAGMIVAVAAGTGAAVAGILRRWGTSRSIAGGVGIALWLHLCFGREEYSAVLYSRNLVIFLSATALWLISSIGSAGRADIARLVTAAAAVGLAVQTNPSSVLTFGIFVGYVAVASAQWDGPLGQRLIGRVRLAPTAFGTVAAGVVGLAPAWYGLRGVFSQFWAQWWTYNSYYTSSTGRGPREIFAKGFDDFTEYYTTHWVQGGVLLIAIPLVLWSLRSPGPRRPLTLTVLAWWVAEVLAVVSAQRFFPHYLILPVVPLAVLAGIAIFSIATSIATSRRASARAVAVRTAAAAALAATMAWSVMPQLGEASELVREYRGRQAAADAHVAELSPDQALLRHLVQINSTPDDYVYIWTKYPWRYTNVDRSAATRFIENRWLTGEVHGGVTSPEYILPGTWQHWKDDILESNPTVIAIENEVPVPVGSPLDDLLGCSALRLVHDDGIVTVHVRRGPLDRCL